MVRWLAAFLMVPVLASVQGAFQLPSGNIHCMTFEGTIRCDIRNAAFRPAPRPHDCEQDYGNAVELGPRGPAQLVCHGDTVVDPRSPVLGYGRAWQGTGLTCAASQAGLRCVNAQGRGFEMARSSLRLF